MSSTKPSHFRFKPTTIEAIDRLSQATDIDNRTFIVSQAVRLADWLVQKKAEGAVINITLPNGEVLNPPFIGF